MRLAYVSFVLFAACGGGGTDNPDMTAVDAAPAKDFGFNKPKDVLKANMETGSSWATIGDADLTCLNTTSTDAAGTVAITLNTHVHDFQNSSTVIPEAKVTIFDGIDFANPFNPAVTSATDGAVTLQIPAGHKRLGIKMAGGSTAADHSVTQLDTLLLNQYLDPSMATQTSPDPIQSVSNTTASLLPALIGQDRTPGTGVVAGALRDCQHHEISNFVATVSSTSGTATPIDGADTYYFSASAKIPVKHTMADASSQDGLFVTIQLPVVPTAYVQMWGFPTAADLASGNMVLIAELKVPVVADTVITGSFEALRK